MTTSKTTTRKAHPMFADTAAFSGFSVDDLSAAAAFYGETLGLRIGGPDHESGQMTLHIASSHDVFVYQKPDHMPATFTILNFRVDDIDNAVDELARRGVRFERYGGIAAEANGVYRREGPPIAWFKDPAGNILSVIEE
jgi:predicted enzyme related to lactoylglutathione lyase